MNSYPNQTPQGNENFPPPYIQAPPPFYYAPPREGMSNALKLGLPITAVVSVIAAIIAVVYGAGGKLATTDIVQRDLDAKITALEKSQNDKLFILEKEIDTLAKSQGADHDTLMKIETKVEANSGNIDVLMRNQNNMPIEMHLDEGPKKK